MRIKGILNPDLEAEIASIGHTDMMVIADSGLPIPKGVRVLDLSLVKNVPTFLQVLEAVRDEMVIESYIYAQEADTKNPAVVARMKELLKDASFSEISHEELKKRSANAKVIIRTGEQSSFANVILVGGVNF